MLSVDRGTYAVYVSKSLRPGSGPRISVSVFKNPNPVTVAATLSSTEDETINIRLTGIVSQGCLFCAIFF